MKDILIVGGYGMLGSEFPKDIPRIMKGVKDISSIEKEIMLRRPKYVINCAGIVGQYKCTDACETYATNLALPVMLGMVCQKIGATLIQYSTFYDGESYYYKSKRLMEDALLDFPNTCIICLPTLFNEDFDIAHYIDNFHLAYTKDVAEWTLENLNSVDVFLCNEGFPSRQNFVEYVGREFTPVARRNNAWEDFDNCQLHEMRYWKAAVDEIRLF